MRAILTAALVAAATIATPVAAIPPPQLLTTSGTSFGKQTVLMQSAPLDVKVWNTSGSEIALNVLQTSVPFKVLSHDCTVLPYPGSCTLRIAVTPQLPILSSWVMGSIEIQSPRGSALVPLSVEPVRILTRHFYNAILGREPEAGGADYWSIQLARLQFMGAGPNDLHYVMAGYFFNSEEYRAAGKSDIGFVQDLYTTFMNRGADPIGLAYWTGQIAAGLPREMVLVSFMFSPEWEAFSAPIVGSGGQRPEADVTMDFYRGLMGRVPDAQSFYYWVGSLRQAQCVGPSAVQTTIETMAASFLASAEYANRGRDDAMHVADLYYAFLRRGADLDGFKFWLDALQGGRMTRDDARRAFMSSPEFTSRLQKVIDAGCYAG